MANLGVMPAQVIQTINNQNKTCYAGYYDNGTRRVRVTVGNRSVTVEDIANTIIQGYDDDQLRIKDIATVTKSYEEVTRNEMAYDGKRALGISIACSPDFDVVKVGEKVQKFMDSVEGRLPAGMECHKVFSSPSV